MNRYFSSLQMVIEDMKDGLKCNFFWIQKNWRENFETGPVVYSARDNFKDVISKCFIPIEILILKPFLGSFRF